MKRKKSAAKSRTKVKKARKTRMAGDYEFPAPPKEWSTPVLKEIPMTPALERLRPLEYFSAGAKRKKT